MLLAKDNYIYYNLSTVDGKTFKGYMHRLIGLAYLDNYKEGYFVDHGDGDNQNCHISNLEWVRHKGNTQRVKNGLGVGRPRIEKEPKVYKTKLELSEGLITEGTDGMSRLVVNTSAILVHYTNRK